MAHYRVLYWHELPSIVEAHDESGVYKEQLSPRFQALIDEAAMQRRFVAMDAYLAGWIKSERIEASGTTEEIAKRIAAEFEARFDESERRRSSRRTPDRRTSVAKRLTFAGLHPNIF